MRSRRLFQTLLFVGLVHSYSLVSGTLMSSRAMSECCRLEEDWSDTQGTRKCQNYPYPIAEEHRQSCLMIVEICCIRTARRNFCEMGRDSARNGLDCTPIPDVGGEAHKDCCEACKLGLSFGKNGASCDLSSAFSFGSPWDESFLSCCRDNIDNNEIIPPIHNASQNRCIPHNVGCSQLCVDTGLSVQCTCNAGYKLARDQRTCSDIDECVEGKHTCNPVSETCLNSPGGFHCVENDPNGPPVRSCPPGYLFNATLRTCDDVNECAVGRHNCPHPKICSNTIGSYKCLSNKSSTTSQGHQCPPGFKRDEADGCIDVDECAEKLDNCDRDIEDCLNAYGEYHCQPRTLSPRHCPAGYKRSQDHSNCEDVDECKEGLHSCLADSEECFNTAGGYNCDIRCLPGMLFHPVRRECIDIDECVERTHSCKPNETCLNTMSSYRCVRSGGDCPRGFRKDYNTKTCIDVDECSEATHDCNNQLNQFCVNTVGSFRCQRRDPFRHCGVGFSFDSSTGNCQDVNECQLGLHDCLGSQRCDNTIGSYTCVRTTGCGTGYTLNANTGDCEDDDECVLGKHNCGPGFACRNSNGNFRCIRLTCPPGQRLLPDGTCLAVNCPTGMEQDAVGTCVDVNECLTMRCRPSQYCVNTVGSFRCENLLSCGVGYELDPSGTRCLDVDECRKGVHECGPSQTCRNRAGGYVCECPKGYNINSKKDCHDIDECEQYDGQVCAQNAICQNTPGSFVCDCKEGFKVLDSAHKNCVDVDECRETPDLCEHNCVNVWGKYQCTCRQGFKLAADNRTCTDIDECALYEGKGNLCIGICVNTPGSFKCSCPHGYRLANDQRTCQDINECSEQGVCQGENQVCLNTRGSYKCNEVVCPAEYVRDRDHKNRCKRTRLDCIRSDEACLQEPLSISYNYLTIASKMRLPSSGQLDIFTMRGPRLTLTSVEFDLKLVDSRLSAPTSDGSAATRQDFFLRRTAFNEVVIALVGSLVGPQDIELHLTMKMYHSGLYGGTALAKFYIYVSQYDF